MTQNSFLGKSPIKGYEIIAKKPRMRKGWSAQCFDIDDECLCFNLSDLNKSSTTYNNRYATNFS